MKTETVVIENSFARLEDLNTSFRTDKYKLALVTFAQSVQDTMDEVKDGLFNLIHYIDGEDDTGLFFSECKLLSVSNIDCMRYVIKYNQRSFIRSVEHNEWIKESK